MIDIEELKPQILKALMPLKPDKIILFGSYAYGIPNEDSDIDLFLLKDDLEIVDMRKYQIELQKKLFDIQKKYLLGIDLFVDNTKRMTHRIEHYKDQFYNDILTKGTILYGK
jgi:predicted nucleotidyltransferase